MFVCVEVTAGCLNVPEVGTKTIRNLLLDVRPSTILLQLLVRSRCVLDEKMANVGWGGGVFCVIRRNSERSVNRGLVFSPSKCSAVVLLHLVFEEILILALGTNAVQIRPSSMA